MKNILITTGCAVLLCLSSIAYSADAPYVSVNAGVAIANDSDGTDSAPPATSFTVESDAGFAVGAAGGYSFGDARGEVEIAYQKNNLDQQTVSGTPTELTGDTTLLSVLVNGYYDFDTGSPFTPFVSGGIGFAKFNINDAKAVGSPNPATNDDDTVFAYQLGAGVDYAINEEVSLGVKYRYLGTTDPEFDTVTIDYSGHNVLVGVRTSF